MSFRVPHFGFQTSIFKFAPVVVLSCVMACAALQTEPARSPPTQVRTLAGAGDARFGEAFGVAVDKNNVVFASDGAGGKIWRIEKNGAATVLTDRLDTPSALAIDRNNFLIVADAGSHTIKRINSATGETTIIAGVENQSGFADGAAGAALFNAPLGVAVAGDKIFVADTYNDRVRAIENGLVKTIAGGERGFANGATGAPAKFDTPCGIAVAANNDLIVADTGNRRLRRIDAGGATTTFAGTGESETRDGWAWQAAFVEPVGVAVDRFGAVYVADAGANQIRVFGRRFVALWETIAGTNRGTTDGSLAEAKFNRPTNAAINANGNLFVADSANKLVRVVKSENEKIGDSISPETARGLFLSTKQMRSGGEPRWTFDPPAAPRDIAGTFGEVRGAIRAPGDAAWFHNGLDVAGALGETARFIRSEKVLRPLAVEDFDQKNNRERIRMPTVGYIHVRLGRDASGKPFDDRRFQFDRDAAGRLTDLRVPRGAKFSAGEAVGTLNPFNHVHLIAGETGAEMNAFAAFVLPGARDSIAPTIEKIVLYDENWSELKLTEPLRGRVRIVARAFDRMDGGSARRRLGVYRLGYQILNADDSPVAGFDNSPETISFERLPDNEFAGLVYAVGSQSGYTPDTVFNYIVTNLVRDGAAREDFLDSAKLQPGNNYKIRVFAWDFFGNQTTQDLTVKKQN